MKNVKFFSLLKAVVFSALFLFPVLLMGQSPTPWNIGGNTIPVGLIPKVGTTNDNPLHLITNSITRMTIHVFEKDYSLMSLQETETFIKENKHLPNIPSAAEVEENGIQLGEMNALLLQKIEELTLHMIEQQKLIEELQKSLFELKSKKGGE
jgi:hypothetical protein